MRKAEPGTARNERRVDGSDDAMAVGAALMRELGR